jgi:hypothetical protein
LGIKEGTTVALFDTPGDLALDLPDGVVVKRATRGTADVVLAFFVQKRRYEQRLERLASMVFPSGGLWIAWPKQTSGMDTDLTDHAVRAAGIARGLVDNKVCAVDDTWTGLRLVWRVERRGSKP